MSRQETFPFTREAQAAAVDAALERLRPALSPVKLRGLRALLAAVLTAPRNECGELPQESIAARLDCTTRTVRNLLDGAVALGLVVVDKPAGMRRARCIRLDFDGLRGVARRGCAAVDLPRPADQASRVEAVAHSAAEPERSELATGEQSPAESVAAIVSPSSPSDGHVRKVFPNVRKVFPIGERAADSFDFIYIPPYPPKPERNGGGGGGVFGEPARSGAGRGGCRSGDDPSGEPGPGWAAAAAALKSIKLGAIAAALEQARRAGRTAADVVAAVRTFEANRDKFKSAGAVRFFLDSGDWPTEAAIVEPGAVERRRAAAEERQAAERARVVELRTSNAAEVDADEAAHGAALDALPDLERDALAAVACRAPGLLDAYRRGRWRERGSMVRECLLSALGAQGVGV